MSRPVRQRFARRPAKQRTAFKGAIDVHGLSAFRRPRQKPSIRLAIGDVVCELNGVDPRVGHHLLELSVTPAMRSCDADIADLAGCPVGGRGVQMVFPVNEIMYRHRVEALHTPNFRASDIWVMPSPASGVHTFVALK